MPERTPNNSPNSLGDGRIHPFTTAPVSIPKTGKPASPQDIKSFVRKILLTSPDFARLYADVVLASAPNSLEAKILAQSYEKIVAYTERTKLMSNPQSCTHIKVTGVPCGSPALRGEEFCYFHQRMLRTFKFPASRVHHSALLEDEESIQASLMEIVNALLRGTIELKRAELILRALNTAVRNIRRVKFSQNANHMVTEIPDYPTPPLEQVDEQYAAELQRHEARAAAARAPKVDPLVEYFGGGDKIPANLRRPAASVPSTNVDTAATTANVGKAATTANVGNGTTTAHVGTAAPGCPSGPSTKKTAAVDSAQPKPPVSDRSAQVLQSRKHRAPSG